jgi:CO dehydrogenase/acetyl-CoA synthase beta subunit
LQERIEIYNNQCIVLQKQNSIGGLKLRLIKDSVETLFKQKIFIMENIERSRVLLLKESEQVEEKMMKQNDDKEYLISIKKAVKLSKEMLDMGFHAIS